MNADKPTDEKNSRSVQNPLIKKIAIGAVVLLSVFLLGFVPMWLTARNRADDLARTESRLRSAQIQNKLAAAVIDARRGEYESARKSASEFFTSLRSEMDQPGDLVLTQAQREIISPLFTQRDEIITLLSRSDPASADRLSNFYVSYRNAIEVP